MDSNRPLRQRKPAPPPENRKIENTQAIALLVTANLECGVQHRSGYLANAQNVIKYCRHELIRGSFRVGEWWCIGINRIPAFPWQIQSGAAHRTPSWPRLFSTTSQEFEE